MDSSLIWWVLATAAAFFIKGLCGFANTPIFNSIMSFSTSQINISPVELLLGYPTNLIIAWRGRRQVDLKMCIPLILLLFSGAVPGALFLKNADTSAIKSFFGLVLMVLGGEMLLREFCLRRQKENRLVLAVIGILSGVLSGIYGVGALLGAYFARVKDTSAEFKANFCFVFFCENTFRVILYACTGIIRLSTLRQALLLAPVMLAGLYSGILCSRFVPEKIMKRCVMVLLILSGIALALT